MIDRDDILQRQAITAVPSVCWGEFARWTSDAHRL